MCSFLPHRKPYRSLQGTLKDPFKGTIGNYLGPYSTLIHLVSKPQSPNPKALNLPGQSNLAYRGSALRPLAGNGHRTNFLGLEVWAPNDPLAFLREF